MCLSRCPNGSHRSAKWPRHYGRKQHLRKLVRSRIDNHSPRRDTWATCPYSEHLPAPEARVSCGSRTRRVIREEAVLEEIGERRVCSARRAAISSAGAAVNSAKCRRTRLGLPCTTAFSNQGIATEAPAHAPPRRTRMRRIPARGLRQACRRLPECPSPSHTPPHPTQETQRRMQCQMVSRERPTEWRRETG
jgi:hypothetical protein